jgi:hypothetical protein
MHLSSNDVLCLLLGIIQHCWCSSFWAFNLQAGSLLHSSCALHCLLCDLHVRLLFAVPSVCLPQLLLLLLHHV